MGATTMNESHENPGRLNAGTATRNQHRPPLEDEQTRRNRALLHELEVHQIELEMQNEALQKYQGELEASRDRYADLFDFAPVAYVTLSTDRYITEANLLAASGLRTAREKLAQQCFDDFVDPVDLERWRQHAAAAWQTPGTRMPDFDLLLRASDGSQIPSQLHCMAMKSHGAAATMRVALFDTTERTAAAAEMQHLAYNDALTDLPNRRLFQDRLCHAVASGRRTGRYGAILFLDLDNFKLLNDTYGHDAGDRMLIEIAHRLRSGLREGDTAARIGGDEFAMILEGLDTSVEGAAKLARQVGEKLRGAIARRIDPGKAAVQCTTSIGVRVFGPADQVESLLSHADLALYDAKRAGRDQVRFFSATP